ncbi:hypothetical protein [Halodesulfurarchaeum sp.]|uniref:hypothetical protein n=1 Tax=Halodesulfurarchaeum sp. TaxID=1980530 RepID=UPI002FC3C280
MFRETDPPVSEDTDEPEPSPEQLTGEPLDSSEAELERTIGLAGGLTIGIGTMIQTVSAYLRLQAREVVKTQR